MMSIDEWRISRNQSVTEAQGDLALVGMHEVRPLTRIDGIPGEWSPINSDKPGLILTATPADGLLINGRLVDGTIELEADYTIVQLPNGLTVTATYQPGSNHLLAVWNAQAIAIQNFKSIDVYPYDTSWIIEAELLESDAQGTFDFIHSADTVQLARSHQSPGEICFIFQGEKYQIRPFASGESLIVVFSDQTSGIETYGMGRMLIVKPNEDGTVKLDFNRAFLPPCAFSPYFNCPMPPAGNRFKFPVTVGEKNLLMNYE